MGNTYNRVYIWCCKYGENRYNERCADKKWCASKHTGLLNSCLGKLCLHPYLVVPLIPARVTLISTRVSAHCQAILLILHASMPFNPCVSKMGVQFIEVSDSKMNWQLMNGTISHRWSFSKRIKGYKTSLPWIICLLQSQLSEAAWQTKNGFKMILW